VIASSARDTRLDAIRSQDQRPNVIPPDVPQKLAAYTQFPSTSSLQTVTNIASSHIHSLTIRDRRQGHQRAQEPPCFGNRGSTTVASDCAFANVSSTEVAEAHSNQPSHASGYHVQPLSLQPAIAPTPSIPRSLHRPPLILHSSLEAQHREEYLAGMTGMFLDRTLSRSTSEASDDHCEP